MEIIELTYMEKIIRMSKQGHGTIPILMLHGFTGNKIDHHRNFIHIANILEKFGYAVYRMDFLGDGESDGNEEDYDITSKIQQGKVVCEYLLAKYEKIQLYGFSLGGVIASKLANIYASNITHVTLVNPAGNFHHIIDQFLELSIPTKNGYDYIGYYFSKELIQHYHTYAYMEDIEQYQQDIAIIYADHDEFVDRKTIDTYHELYQHSNLYILHECDHCFRSIEQTTKLLDTISDIYGGQK